MSDPAAPQNQPENTPPPPPSSPDPGPNPGPNPAAAPAATAAPAAAKPEPGSELPPEVSKAEAEQGKVISILSYIFPILCLVGLIQRDNAFTLYHAKQVLIMAIGCFAGSILSVIPLVGCVIAPLVLVGWIVFAILGILNVVNLRMKPLPLIGKLGEDWFKGMTVKPKAT